MRHMRIVGAEVEEKRAGPMDGDEILRLAKASVGCPTSIAGGASPSRIEVSLGGWRQGYSAVSIA